ncbi:hypothetical protein WJX74_009000 [Apatococcus lobatus]|uniref:Uncharacterized protein n=1 Tax=Apatococcus lobatus TaxID=904363 RepID=A0AAW1RFH7_9CHLO
MPQQHRTLDAFLNRASSLPPAELAASLDTVASVPVTDLTGPPQEQRSYGPQRQLARQLLRQQTEGRSLPWLRRHCQQSLWGSYSQVASGTFAEESSHVYFATSSSTCASTWAARRPPPGRCVGRDQLPATGRLASLDVCLGAEDAPGSTTSLQFDSGGELLLAGMSCGLLSVHRWEQLQSWAGSMRPSRTPAPSALLLLHTMRKQTAVKWNHQDERMVSSVAATEGDVKIYNLEATKGAPTKRLLPDSTGGSDVTPSLWDLAWIPGNSQLLAAGASRGRALLWDMRAPKAPQCWLTADRLGASIGHVHCLEATHDGKCLVAGCRSGEILVWDLRGGSRGGVSFGGSGPVRHPLMQATHLVRACQRVADEDAPAFLGCAALQTLSLDPADDHRCAFQLGCGVAGVLDLVSQQVTHLYYQQLQELKQQPGFIPGTTVPSTTSSSHNQHQAQLDNGRHGMFDFRGMGNTTSSYENLEWYPEHVRAHCETKRCRGSWSPHGPTYCCGDLNTRQVWMVDFAANGPARLSTADPQTSQVLPMVPQEHEEEWQSCRQPCAKLLPRMQRSPLHATSPVPTVPGLELQRRVIAMCNLSKIFGGRSSTGEQRDTPSTGRDVKGAKTVKEIQAWSGGVENVQALPAVWQGQHGQKRVTGEFLYLKSLELPWVYDLQIFGRTGLTWRLKLKNFPKGTKGGRELNADLDRLDREHGQDHLLMEIEFPTNYPQSPPFMRLVTPKTEWYTGFVSCDGALLLEPLTVGGWKNNMCVEDMLVAAIYAMCDCDKGVVAAGSVAGPGGETGPLCVHFDADVVQEHNKDAAKASLFRMEKNARNGSYHY